VHVLRLRILANVPRMPVLESIQNQEKLICVHKNLL
jgi:hypothetical protein